MHADAYPPEYWDTRPDLRHIFTKRAEISLEAAAPHMVAGIVARIDENVTALENTLVDERDYPALCAQREALIGVMQMLRDEPTP